MTAWDVLFWCAFLGIVLVLTALLADGIMKIILS